MDGFEIEGVGWGYKKKYRPTVRRAAPKPNENNLPTVLINVFWRSNECGKRSLVVQI